MYNQHTSIQVLVQRRTIFTFNDTILLIVSENNRISRFQTENGCTGGSVPAISTVTGKRSASFRFFSARSGKRPEEELRSR